MVFFCFFGSCTSSNKEEINATEHIGNGDKVFHFPSALLPCLVVFSLISRVICSKMCQFLCTLSKRLCTHSSPHILIRVFVSLTTHFVYFHTNMRANVIIRARYQAQTLNTKMCNMHVISGLQLKVASNHLWKWIVWKRIRFESWLIQLQCER